MLRRGPPKTLLKIIVIIVTTIMIALAAMVLLSMGVSEFLAIQNLFSWDPLSDLTIACELTLHLVGFHTNVTAPAAFY